MEMHCKNAKIYYITLATILTIILYLYYTQTENKLKYFTLIESEPPDLNFTLLTPIQNNRLFDINFHYILNNENVCKNGSNILAVFIVTSYFGNVETRSAMRRAFPLESLKQLNFRRVFLLGEGPKDKYTTQVAIEAENRRFQDIVQGNFNEDYRNLTYKHVMGLKWANAFCSKARFIVKMDDDIVVNIRRITLLFNNLKIPKSNDFLAGYILRGMSPLRDPANKWYVTSTEYKDSAYPTFVSGWFYVTNPQTSAKLVKLSNYIKYFWIDDVYVTGILAKKLKIRHYDVSKYFTVHSEFLDCCINDIRKNKLDCDILVGPNGGNNNLFFEFNDVIKTCILSKCSLREKSLNETCVAERKINLGKGDAIVENYKLH